MDKIYSEKKIRQIEEAIVGKEIALAVTDVNGPNNDIYNVTLYFTDGTHLYISADSHRGLVWGCSKVVASEHIEELKRELKHYEQVVVKQNNKKEKE